MGIIISTTRYAPFALVTGIIGIISFVFTLGTFLKVLWINFETLGQAPHEVHAYLTNLRTELLEEKASIRLMRKQCKKYRGRGADALLGPELDDQTLKTMGDTVKYLIKRFKALEKPFLVEGSEGIADWEKHRRRRKTRDDSSSPYYEHAAYARGHAHDNSDRRKSRGSDLERRRGRSQHPEEDDDAETFWAERQQYKHFGLACRLAWLSRKSEAQDLFSTLSRVQIRRIARQVGGMTVAIHDHAMAQEQALRRIEDRMSNIVGVRRVE